MASSSYILFAVGGAWHIAAVNGDTCALSDVAVPQGAASEQEADVVAAALASTGYAGQGLVLALPSEWCLCAAIQTDDLPSADRRAAMLYRLEEKLPIAAEEVVADFIAGEGRAMGVAVPRERLAPIVEALESRDIAVEVIAPAALLALRGWLGRADVESADVVAWSTGERIELFLLRDGVPRAWYVLPNLPRDLLLHVGLELAGDSKPRRIVGICLPKPLREALSALPRVELIDAGESSLHESAAWAGAAVLAGTSGSWVNLRRDALAPRHPLRQVRRPLALAATAAALCLACFIAAALWRAGRYDAVAANYAAEQQEVFRRTFPKQPAPADIPSRLASEERGLRGLSGDVAAPPPDAPGLMVLGDLLAGLPTGVRFRVLELRLDAGRFTLEGQARSHGDADAIAAALRKNKNFSVEPPRTEQLPDSAGGAVAFTLSGTARADAPLAGATARRAAP